MAQVNEEVEPLGLVEAGTADLVVPGNDPLGGGLSDQRQSPENGAVSEEVSLMEGSSSTRDGNHGEDSAEGGVGSRGNLGKWVSNMDPHPCF